jgi:DNA mismatch endonuclease (patch repair protein)
MDKISPEQRSAVMRSIRSFDTKPEMVVRKVVTRLGYRYRLHVRSLPGSPDLVFRSKRKAIFVNGCFWHFHQKCGTAHFPESRLEYWGAKLQRNRNRDTLNLRQLKQLGWKVLVVWECEVKDLRRVRCRLDRFLNSV